MNKLNDKSMLERLCLVSRSEVDSMVGSFMTPRVASGNEIQCSCPPEIFIPVAQIPTPFRVQLVPHTVHDYLH